MNTIQKILYYIFVPQSAQWNNEDVKINEVLIIDKKYSFEAGLFIDLLFYGYIIIAITSWFYPHIFIHSSFYFIMVSVLFTSILIRPLIRSVFQNKGKI